MLFELNITYGRLHRDIHEKNIMLRTNDDITRTKELSGELCFIDFGHSKRIYDRPTADDYKLTFGGRMIQYPQDKERVENLKPNPRMPEANIFKH